MAILDLIPWNRERAPAAGGWRDEPFATLQREVDRLFDDFARGFALGQPFEREGFAPRVDVCERDDELIVTAEVPGLEEKDFEVNLSPATLTIRGEKRREHEEKGAVHRLERSWGAFERTLALPCDVDPDRATASYHNGVLRISLPKSEAARRRVRRIEVASG
jgi:HSP20 family protein